MTRPEEILAFWFTEPVKSHWFNSSPELDEQIREHFVATWQAAQEGALADWEQTAEGACALVIVLDQFPLNMYRGEARSFSTEAASRQVAARAIARGFDQQLNDEQKVFLYMPYMHSEDLADQERAVAFYEAAGLRENAKYALHHRDIVQRFGRFPHRNHSLGRKNTEAEEAYLHSDEAFLG